MPTRVSADPLPEEAYKQARQALGNLRALLIERKQSMAAGATEAERLRDLKLRIAGYTAQLTSLRGVQHIDDQAKASEREPAYEFSTELQKLLTALGQVTTALDAVMPPESFDPSETAGIRTAIDAVVAETQVVVRP